MKIWHVKFTQWCFSLEAVVVEETGEAAIARLKLTEEQRLKPGRPQCIGLAYGNLTPRVITRDHF